jgi:hypothetical protein
MIRVLIPFIQRNKNDIVNYKGLQLSFSCLVLLGYTRNFMEWSNNERSEEAKLEM